MVVIDSRLDWIDLEHRRQTYIYENNLKRVIQLEITAFLIFVFGNLGMRFIGLLSFIKLLPTIFKDYFNLTQLNLDNNQLEKIIIHNYSDFEISIDSL